MAAVMVSVEPVRRRDGIIEDRGHDLMMTWATYRRGGSRTRSPVSSGSWSEPLDKATDCEPRWVLMIDDMLAEVYRAQEVYRFIVEKYFLDGLASWDVAEKAKRTPGFISMTINGISVLAHNRVPE